MEVSLLLSRTQGYCYHLSKFHIVIHTAKVFIIVNEADVFLEFPCFFFSYDPSNVGNLISGSSAFAKSSLNILLKPKPKPSPRKRNAKDKMAV